MTKYRSERSAITDYKIEDDRILVQFKGGKIYSYSYAKAGKQHVDKMKELAESGEGLGSNIMKNVRTKYD